MPRWSSPKRICRKMVNSWNVSNLSDWGNRIINGPNGIRSRAGTCSVFTGGSSVTPPAEPDPSPTPLTYGDCSGLPVWTATTVYDQSGTLVQYNDRVYENQWYTTDQNPEEFSDEFEVWKVYGRLFKWRFHSGTNQRGYYSSYPSADPGSYPGPNPGTNRKYR